MRSLIAASIVGGAFAAALYSNSLCAQRAPIQAGVLAGANLSSVSVLDAGLAAGEGLIDERRRGGAQAAFYAVIPLTGRFSLQPELHYVQKGGKATVTLPIDEEQLALFADDRMTVGLRLSYVELPLLGRFELGSLAGWRPFLVAGPSFALRVGCKVSTEIGPLSLSGSCDDDGALPDEEMATESSDPVRTTDVGAVGGIGLQGSLLGRSFSAQLRYTQGLRSIAREEIPGVSPKNRGLALVLGLGF